MTGFYTPPVPVESAIVEVYLRRTWERLRRTRQSFKKEKAWIWSESPNPVRGTHNKNDNNQIHELAVEDSSAIAFLDIIDWHPSLIIGILMPSLRSIRFFKSEAIFLCFIPSAGTKFRLLARKTWIAGKRRWQRKSAFSRYVNLFSSRLRLHLPSWASTRQGQQHYLFLNCITPVTPPWCGVSAHTIIAGVPMPWVDSFDSIGCQAWVDSLDSIGCQGRRSIEIIIHSVHQILNEFKSLR